MLSGRIPTNYCTIVRSFIPPAQRRRQWRRVGLATAYRLAPSLTEAWLERRFLTPARHAWPPQEQPWLASAEHSTLTTFGLPLPHMNDRMMRVYRWGQGQRGRIVLLHGWGGRATQWHAFIAAFVAAGYSVLAIDAPGHGASAGRQSSALHLLNALEALIWEAGPVDAVLGHSMGGGVVLRALTQGLAAKRAVLIAPITDLTLHSHRVARSLGLSEAQRNSLQHRIEWRFGVSWDQLNALPDAGSLSQPGLVIHDQGDKEVPVSVGEAVAAAWPGSRMIRTAALGHRRILTDPGVVAATLAFVESGQ